MKSPAVSAKKRHGGGAGFGLGCGCKDAKSVSVSASPFLSATTGTSTTTGTRRGGTWRNPSASTTTDTLTLTSASSCSLWEDAVAELGYKDGGCRLQESSVPTPSFSGLLRELSELEQSVASWGRKGHHHEEKHSPSPPPMQQEHRRAKGDFRSAKEDRFGVDGDGGVGLDGSVAVVKQSDDPLGDFRRSMLQMIVENGIVAGEDLREMLRRFLALNAPHHHDAILRAFAEIWDDVFAAASHDATPSRAPVSRREPGRPPVPRTPPRRHRSPPAWRV
ncbi:transcription repressor OFP8-like [Phragmites australis]|uniref:transcription repressor OFP8-like n=1 Tax=Phragmites australis TaxID=29695 RepID=UPI002D77EC94|nr:transcription repressor OFP8-like [Phragmites australis]